MGRPVSLPNAFTPPHPALINVTINTQFSLKPTKMQLTLKFVLFGALVALANAVTCPVCGAIKQQPGQCDYVDAHRYLIQPTAGGAAGNAGADAPQNADDADSEN